MHPADYVAIRAAYDDAVARFDEARPVLEVPWKLREETVDALRAAYGDALELRVGGEVQP
jgi:hypothetical protein